MSTRSNYSSSPDRRSIRLLRVLDSAPNNGSALYCSLDTYSLDREHPKYVALSYTWGSPSTSKATVERYEQHPGITISVSHDGRPAVTQVIQKNLFDALTYIHAGQWRRYWHSDDKPYSDVGSWVPHPEDRWRSFIWADAVCIDQDNIDEREVQTKLMKDIYSRCVYAVSWLGPHCVDPKCNDSCKDSPNWECVRFFYGRFGHYVQDYRNRNRGKQPHPAHQGWDRSKVFKTCGENEAATFDPRPGGNTYFKFPATEMRVNLACIDNLRHFLVGRRFFQRAWILQEMTLCPNAVLLVGDFVLSQDIHAHLSSWMSCHWQTLRVQLAYFTSAPVMPMLSGVLETADTIKKLASSSIRYDFSGFQREQSAVVSMTQWLMQLWGAESAQKRKLVYIALLLWIKQSLSATQARDEIFAILGIAEWLEPEGPLPAGLDYRLDAAESYRLFAIELLQQIPSLGMFALLSSYSQRKMSDLPSWVPDWSATSGLNLVGGVQYLTRQQTASRGRTLFDACPNRTEATSAIEIDGKTLRLTGYRCGKLTTVVNPLRQKVKRLETRILPNGVTGKYWQLYAFSTPLISIADAIGTKYPLTGQDIFAAVSAVGAISSPDANRKPSRTLADFRAWLTLMLQIRIRDISVLTAKDQAQAEAQTNDTAVSDPDSAPSAPDPASPTPSFFARDMARLHRFQGQLGAPCISDIGHCRPPHWHWYREGAIPVPPAAVERCNARFNAAFLHRSLFAAENGAIGLCPVSAKPGDELWVPAAGKVPQVLRPVETEDGVERYLIMGEAYVHGGMDGELFEQGLAEGRRRIEIV